MYMHTYIYDAYILTSIDLYMSTYLPTYIHWYISTYACINIDVNTYIH